MRFDQTLVDWQVAPANYELNNYDEPKIRYRRMVEDSIRPLSAKSIRKKTFYTIATNVLCADIHSSKDTIDPIDRDLYLPLEIAITKWSLSGSNQPEGEKKNYKVWMINPGPPPRGSINYALEHQPHHKIDINIHRNITDDEQNQFAQEAETVMKDINSFLSSDRTVFSLSLKHCRQDLGSLKWLNKQTCYKSKPISVYNIIDLYVVLMRTLCPDSSVGSQAIAEYRLNFQKYTGEYISECTYHDCKAQAEVDGSTENCALALSLGHSRALVEDVISFGMSNK